MNTGKNFAATDCESKIKFPKPKNPYREAS